MTIEWSSIRCGVWLPIVVILQLTSSVWSKKVYMDKSGDCFHGGPFDVEDEKVTIFSQGGEPYDTNICEMVFKSVKNDRLCLSFTSFSINRCGVDLTVYSQQSATGTVMGQYNCNTDGTPQSVCTEGRYLTVKLYKSQLGHDGYNFDMEIREFSQRDAFADGIDAFIVSIGMIIAIIVGVIVIVVIVAIVIVCCCCQDRRYTLGYRPSYKSTSCRMTGVSEVLPGPIEPSAPPLPDEAPPAYSDSPPPYIPVAETANTDTHTIDEKAAV